MIATRSLSKLTVTSKIFFESLDVQMKRMSQMQQFDELREKIRKLSGVTAKDTLDAANAAETNTARPD